MNTEYGYAVDGMLYHQSQVTEDANGRLHPREGAQVGYILKATEFGELPELTPEAAALVAEWRSRRGYATKVVVPEVGGGATLPVEPVPAPEPDDVAETVSGDDADSARARRRGSR